MADHDLEAVVGRLRAQLAAVEGLARRWSSAADRKVAPEGFRVPEDAAVAAAEVRRVLERARVG